MKNKKPTTFNVGDSVVLVCSTAGLIENMVAKVSVAKKIVMNR